MADDVASPARELNNGETLARRADEEPDAGEDAQAPAVETSDDAVAAHGWKSPLRLAILTGVVMVVALGALAGWLGWQRVQVTRADAQRNVFLQVGRQGAVNLTTIDFQHVDSDITRILDGATGPFHDDFSSRSAQFIDVVKQFKSKSVGTITEAGIETSSSDTADVVVAVRVTTSNDGAPEQEPRAWRMRITVQKVDAEAKVSNVVFIP